MVFPLTNSPGCVPPAPPRSRHSLRAGGRWWQPWKRLRDMYGTPDRHTLLESPGSGSTANTWASVFVTPRKHRHNVAALPPAHATPAPPTTQSAARRYCRARRLVAASSGAVWGLASPALLILGGGWEWLALARLAWAVGMLLLNNPHSWTPLRGLRCALLVRLAAWSVLAPAIGVVLFYDPVLPQQLPLSLLLLLMLLEGATAPPPAISDGHFLERQLQVAAPQASGPAALHPTPAAAAIAPPRPTPHAPCRATP